MVKFNLIFLLSFSSLAVAGSFCGSHSTPELRAAAAPFALQDAQDFPDQLTADGTNLVVPPAARGGATLSGWWKKLGWDVPNKKWITIKTYIHVVAASKKYEDGWVSEKAVLQQFFALNEGYAAQNIRFSLQGVTRTINPAWANWNAELEPTELARRNALRKGDYKTLNVYILKRLPFNSYGVAAFPQPPATVPPGSIKFITDGVDVLYNTLPGGLYPYDEGKTLVHEVGHWLMLIHVFESSTNCQGVGDYVADTPVQSISTGEGDGVPVGCPITKDSCPNLPGFDNVKNFMDYTDDACLSEFTAGQKKRMHEAWYTYRDIKDRKDWYN